MSEGSTPDTAEQIAEQAAATERDHKHVLTEADLNTARHLIAVGQRVPADLVARLLYDREVWIERAYESAGATRPRPAV